jgi:hypothetical protein
VCYRIEYPYQFLDEILTRCPQQRILITFQNLDYIFAHNSWQSFTHDHRNYFLHEEFELRYSVLDSGTFSAGERSYIVITSAPLFEGENIRDRIERKSGGAKTLDIEKSF